jgi:mycothiol synthase
MEIVLRAIRPEDLASIHRLQRRAELHDGLPMATPAEEFEGWLDEPHFDLATDSRVVEVDGEVAGWGRVWHRPSGTREERAYLPGAVDPAHRTKGIGSALLRWQLARAETILRATPLPLPRFIRVQAYDSQASALRLYARHGMAPVRYNDELLRDLDVLPEPSALDGVTVVPWDASRSEDARVAQNDAFADHWGSTPLDRAAWDHHLASFGRRPDLSFLALDAGRVVGVCFNGYFPDDEPVTGRRDGWIMQVSVIRSHRKRGIASALVVASLRAFKDAGLTHSALGVDSENPTGAYHLYERLGYRPVARLIVHQRSA